jgi:hypothetical protein
MYLKILILLYTVLYTHKIRHFNLFQRFPSNSEPREGSGYVWVQCGVRYPGGSRGVLHEDLQDQDHPLWAAAHRLRLRFPGYITVICIDSTIFCHKQAVSGATVAPCLPLQRQRARFQRCKAKMFQPRMG